MNFGNQNTMKHMNRQPDNTSLVTMYISFVLLVLLVFGFMGIKSNLTHINRLEEKIAQTNKTTQEVVDRKNYLTNTEKWLNSNLPQEQVLNTMIPSGQSFEKYVEEIVDANTQYGFDVTKVNFETQRLKKTEADAVIVFETTKTDYKLEDLVKSLEKTPRLSVIDKMSYNTISNMKEFKVDLKVFMVPQ